MDGLGGEAIRTDFDIEPENMKVNVSCNVLKHIYLGRHTILSEVEKNPARTICR